MIRAFLGGSFDPVHLSHLQMATAVYTTLSAHVPSGEISLALLPTAGNPLKHRPSDNAHRLAMLRLATLDTPFVIDEREIVQIPPVYTIDTVQILDKLYPNDSKILIVGQDSLANFDKWKNYADILNHVNLWAFARADSGDIVAFLQDRLTTDLDEFLHNKGKVFLDSTVIDTMSSSQIRSHIAKGEPVEAFLSTKVANYIKQHRLYML